MNDVRIGQSGRGALMSTRWVTSRAWRGRRDLVTFSGYGWAEGGGDAGRGMLFVTACTSPRVLTFE